MNVVIKENYLGGGLNKAVILLKCAAALLIHTLTWVFYFHNMVA